MGGGGGVVDAALEAAARLLGLSGRTARGEANGDDDDDDDDEEEEDEDEETTSLEDSSLSSDGREGFEAALATRKDL